MRAGISRRLNLISAAVAVLTAFTASAQTFSKIIDFDKSNGATPFHTSLIQGLDGNLYGTTSGGGSYSCPNAGCGTVFGITPNGDVAKIFSFDVIDGAYPYGGLVQTGNGAFFGTTSAGGLGGSNGSGTVFELTPAGRLVAIYSFCSQTNCADGNAPNSGLLRASNGYFYGTTCSGGSFNNGTVFKVSPVGKLTSVYSFNGPNDGSCPFGALMQATNGNIYGATSSGGPNQYGTVFSITLEDEISTLHIFAGPPFDGSYPNSTLVQGTDGSLYGTTLLGGGCPALPFSGCGTVFKVAADGKLSTIYSFCMNGSPCTDGQSPADGLVLGSDGNLYGTSGFGGSIVNAGTVFRITTSGTLTTLHSLNNTNKDGKYPFTTLVQATNGKFYGTTEEGGIHGRGTIFSVDSGLAPFVKMQPVLGKVGTRIFILGTDLSATTSIRFNGTPAAFSVVSDSLITAMVPAGATTGMIRVTTSSGRLSSNVPFRVLE